MKNMLILALRWIVGLLFIFSGLIKANDPLGLAYKMEEYFAVWHWDWASPYSLYLSIGMNLLEILAGLALLLGVAASWVTRLLLLLILFFTYLTGYAVFSGKIKTCGCFGDCVPLLAWQSFAKDLVLLGFIVILARQAHHIRPVANMRANLFLLLFAGGFVFWGQLYVIKHLPYVDCLPYKKGNNLLLQMQPPAGAVPDSVAILYTYKYNGKEISFDAMNFPADFNDSTYTYVGRTEKLIRKGNAEPAIKDFALYTVAGTDTTKQILATTGPYLLFFAKDFDGKSPEWKELWTKIYMQASEQRLPVLVLSNQPAAAQYWFNQYNQFAVPILTTDGTVMKTILRSPIGIVAMQGASVAGKWSETDMNNVVQWMHQLPKK